MTPQDTLARAAKLIRERASAAVPGPWLVSDGNHVAVPMAQLPNPSARGMNAAHPYELAGPTDATTRHIASWHPGAALPIAAMLDEIAQDWESARYRPWAPSVVNAARAYLGVSQ